MRKYALPLILGVVFLLLLPVSGLTNSENNWCTADGKTIASFPKTTKLAVAPYDILIINISPFFDVTVKYAYYRKDLGMAIIEKVQILYGSDKQSGFGDNPGDVYYENMHGLKKGRSLTIQATLKEKSCGVVIKFVKINDQGQAEFTLQVVPLLK